MSAVTATVRILDKEYRVACSEDERADLEAAARHLDDTMRSIRSSGKVIGLERIAVMAALNIAHEMQSGAEQAGETDQRLRQMISKIDQCLDANRQLEL